MCTWKPALSAVPKDERLDRPDTLLSDPNTRLCLACRTGLSPFSPLAKDAEGREVISISLAEGVHGRSDILDAIADRADSLRGRVRSRVV